MRRAFFFIVAIAFATTSFASIPRTSVLDPAPAIATPSAETRVWASDVLAPFECQAPSLLSRALRQGYEQAGTTNASGLAGFLSVDPIFDVKRALRQAQMWNRYAYALNNPLRFIDPTGMLTYQATVLGVDVRVHIDDELDEKAQLALKATIDASFALGRKS